MSNLRKKLRNQESVNGMHITLSHPAVTELCAQIGFDFLWFDSEHSPMDYGPILNNLIAAKAGGTPVIVRIPWNDEVLAKRVLEMGPEGILFPMIDTKDEAISALNSTYYPPYGNRGFGPQRAIRYGLDDASEYIQNSRNNIVRILQIESKECIDNDLEKICDDDRIDCVMLGPCDLSASMGLLPDIMCKESIKIQDKALNIIRKSGKSAGTSIGTMDKKIIQRWQDRGANVISCNTEMTYIINGARQTLSMLQNKKNELKNNDSYI